MSEHHDDPWSHVPPPSIWPFLVGAIGLSTVSIGAIAVLGLFGEGTQTSVPLLLGGLITLFALMGWCHQVIVEKPISHDLDGQQKDLTLFTKCFLVSELTAFGAVFAYFYVRSFVDDGFQPPLGVNLATPLVGVATMLLIMSSGTCEIAHRAFEHGNRQLARFMMAATILLGVVFIGFQAYEYGELIYAGFTPAGLGDTRFNSFSSTFYIATGFHGVHVLVGLVMLALVALRMEFGHMDSKRHFSMKAASLYWHFVDIVWILLFITIYVMAPSGPGASY